MRVMTRNQERLLRELVAFAGGPIVLQDALAALNEELGGPPTLEQLLRRVAEIREEQEAPLAAAR